MLKIKPNMRILGIDDGPFTKYKSDHAKLVGVLMRLDRVIEKIAFSEIKVDGDDIIESSMKILNEIRVRPSVVMFDGISFGGLNILDPEEMKNRSRIPVLTFHRGIPDIDSMIRAVRKVESGNDHGLKVLSSVTPDTYVVLGRTVTVNSAGLSSEEIEFLLRRLSITGITPEPLRLAKLIANAIHENNRGN